MATSQKETATTTPLRRSPRFQSQNPNPKRSVSNKMERGLASISLLMARNPKETATTPFRRSPRFQSQNPNHNPSISNKKEHSLSSICKSHPKSTPFSCSSKRSTSTKKPHCGIQKRASNVSENLTKKDSLLDLSSCRRSGRLALIDTTNFCSFEEIENGGVRISNSKKNISLSCRASKKDATCELNHDSPLPRRSIRLTKSNQQNFLSKIDSGSLVQCNSAVRQKALEKDRSEFSTEKRKSPGLSEIGKNNGESCLKAQNNQLISDKSRKGYTVCGNASKKDISVYRRQSKRTENKKIEITKKESENEDALRGKKRKREETVELEPPVECSNGELGVGFDGWSEEQELALKKAYFTARPSPHFWKKVSKMVPGKNEQECFNKIHSSIKTPPSIPPKSRLNKTQDLSPFHNFDLLQNRNFGQNPKPKRVSKQKRAVDVRKTVRSILKKQQIESHIKEADYFSQFETSPFQLPSDFNISEICSSSSVPQKKRSSRLKRNPNPGSEPSPAVLKPIKNMALHEKYIDHLHCVDAKRRACVRVCKESKGKTVNLKDLKVSLVSEAQDYIGYFKRVQSDPFGDFVRSDEEDEL